jgi:hypothetical protein
MTPKEFVFGNTYVCSNHVIWGVKGMKPLVLPRFKIQNYFLAQRTDYAEFPDY